MDKGLNVIFGGRAAGRYCPSPNFELTGRAFELIMDSGPDVKLRFTGNKTVSRSDGGGDAADAACQCLKAGDGLYFVTLEPASARPRVCDSFALDLKNRLVTRVTSTEDLGGGLGIVTYFRFGAIRGDDGSVPDARHSLTDDLVGAAVQWTTGPSRICVYDYFRPDACRVECFSDPFERSAGNAHPAGEIPAVYIKLRDGFYLTCLTERREGMALTLCTLQDYFRLLAVGCAFGPLPSDGADSALVMLGAYGKFIDS
jgi:hypothetical protein